MTGAEFLAYVKRIFIRSDKDTEIYEATTDVIADMRLQLKMQDSKTRASALGGCNNVGDYSLSLPSDFCHLIGDVTMNGDSDETDYGTLNKISIQEYDKKYTQRNMLSTDRDTGIPLDYCLYGTNIFVGPPVDKTDYNFYINYTTEDYTSISASISSVPFTSKYRNVLRMGVLGEMYGLLEQFDEANYWRGLYVDGLLKIKTKEDENVADKELVHYHGI